MSTNTQAVTRDIGQKLIEEAAEKSNTSKVIDTLFKELEKESKAVIPEIVFAARYAPMFADYVTGAITEDNAVLAEWTSIAGSPYNEVDIIDKNGIVVDTVPGLLIKPVAGAPLNKLSIPGVLNEYEKKVNITPEIGNRFLDANLNVVKENVKPINGEQVNQWGRILKKYVAVEEAPASKNKPSKQPAQQHSDKLVLEYD